MNRTLVALTTVAAAVSLAATAQAAPPKGFTKTVSFTDATPDPTGYASGASETHCLGLLPMEAPIELKVPGPGMVDVELSGFQGDWSLMITDAAGEVLGGADVNPPEFEAATVRLKKPATIKIHPCNFAGTPQASVKITYKYKK